jgi:hypothetical protein
MALDTPLKRSKNGWTTITDPMRTDFARPMGYVRTLTSRGVY